MLVYVLIRNSVTLRSNRGSNMVSFAKTHARLPFYAVVVLLTIADAPFCKSSRDGTVAITLFSYSALPYQFL